jgi:hypothetical protein
MAPGPQSPPDEQKTPLYLRKPWGKVNRYYERKPMD